MRSADNIIITLLQQIAASGGGGGGGGGAGTNGAITGGSLTVNTSGVSINLPAYLTTAALSQNTSNYAGINGAITGGSITVNTSGVSVNLPAYLTTAAQSGATSNYAGINGAITGGSITVNTSGVSVNLPAYLTTADLSQNSSKYAGINGAITGGSITVNTSGVSVNLPAYLTTAALSQNTSNYAGINSAITGGSMTVNTSGISVNIPASAPATISFYENVIGGPAGMSTSANVSGSSIKVAPFNLHNYISASYIRFFGQLNLASTSFATSAVPWSTTFSATAQLNAVIYTQGVGASSRSLQYLTSGSAGWTWQISATGANATNNWTVTANMTYPSEGANTANTGWNSAQTISTVQISTTDATYANFVGSRYIDVPFAASLSPGVYWLGLNASAGTVGGQAIGFGSSIYGVTNANINWDKINQATNSSDCIAPGVGNWSTNTFGTTTSSIGLANISSVASNWRPYFQFIRQA